MQYVPESIHETLKALGASQLFVHGEHGLVQWHKEDYTLVAQAEYEIMGAYDAGTEIFQRWGSDEKWLAVGEAELLDLLRTLAKESGPVEFLCKKDGRFYIARTFELCEPEMPFPQEVTRLQKLFVDCMVGLEEGKEGGQEHVALVERFQSGFESFLDRYKGQSVGAFAAYIAELGVPHGRAVSDIVRIFNLYTSGRPDERRSEPESRGRGRLQISQGLVMRGSGGE